MLEAHRNPRAFKRACTHYIQASAVPTLRRLGLDTAIEAAGGVHNSVDFWTPFGWVSDEFIGARNDGSEAQAQHPTQRPGTDDPRDRRVLPGVDRLLGLKVTDLLLEDGRLAGVLARRGWRERSRDPRRLTIGADGRNSAWRRKAACASPPPRTAGSVLRLLAGSTSG